MADFADWKETKTKDGQVYYYNKKTKETAWDDPRVAAVDVDDVDFGDFDDDDFTGYEVEGDDDGEFDIDGFDFDSDDDTLNDMASQLEEQAEREANALERKAKMAGALENAKLIKDFDGKGPVKSEKQAGAVLGVVAAKAVAKSGGKPPVPVAGAKTVVTVVKKVVNKRPATDPQPNAEELDKTLGDLRKVTRLATKEVEDEAEDDDEEDVAADELGEHSQKLLALVKLFDFKVYDDDEAWLAPLVEKGMFARITAILSKFSEGGAKFREVRFGCIKALQASATFPKFIIKAVEGDVVSSVIKALRTELDQKEWTPALVALSLHIIALLGNMAGNDHVRTLIRMDGGIQELFNFANNIPKQKKLQNADIITALDSIAFAFTNLAIDNAENCNLICEHEEGKQENLTLILALAGKQSESDKVCNSTFTLISNLGATGDSQRLALVACGAKQFVTKVVELQLTLLAKEKDVTKKGTILEVLINGLSALGCLCLADDNIPEMIDEKLGVIAMLTKCLTIALPEKQSKTNKSEFDVYATAMEVVCALTENALPDQLVRMVKQNIFTSMSTAALKAPSNTGIQSAFSSCTANIAVDISSEVSCPALPVVPVLLQLMSQVLPLAAKAPADKDLLKILSQQAKTLNKISTVQGLKKVWTDDKNKDLWIGNVLKATMKHKGQKDTTVGNALACLFNIVNAADMDASVTEDGDKKIPFNDMLAKNGILEALNTVLERYNTKKEVVIYLFKLLNALAATQACAAGVLQVNVPVLIKEVAKYAKVNPVIEAFAPIAGTICNTSANNVKSLAGGDMVPLIVKLIKAHVLATTEYTSASQATNKIAPTLLVGLFMSLTNMMEAEAKLKLKTIIPIMKEGKVDSLVKLLQTKTAAAAAGDQAAIDSIGGKVDMLDATFKIFLSQLSGTRLSSEEESFRSMSELEKKDYFASKFKIPKLDQNAKIFLVRGQVLKKHHPKSKPSQRHIYMSNSGTFLHWRDPKKGNKGELGVLPIRLITKIESGNVSDVLKRKSVLGKAAASSDCTFVVTAVNDKAKRDKYGKFPLKEHNFEVLSAVDRDRWVKFLTIAMEHRKAVESLRGNLTKEEHAKYHGGLEEEDKPTGLTGTLLRKVKGAGDVVGGTLRRSISKVANITKKDADFVTKNLKK